MKKSMRFFITGAIQKTIFNEFIKINADKLGIKGFTRVKDDGKIEVFIEGDKNSIDEMSALCKRGPPHAIIRDVKEQEEKFQDFKEFKILNF